MRPFLVRAVGIAIITILQLYVGPYIIFSLAVGMLLMVYISAREAYLLIAAVCLILDLMHWRFFGIPTSAAVLLTMKGIELLVLHPRSTEISPVELMGVIGIASIVYVIPGIAFGSLSAWVVHALGVIVFITFATGALMPPIAWCSGWYRRMLDHRPW